jgi:Ca2+-binding RTX toxin-like protein
MGSSARETLSGGGGNDTIAGALGNDKLSGDDGNDWLSGGPGNDTLDGGAGADRLTGGAGNDYYVVSSALDVVIEAAGGGNDWVSSASSFTLGPNIETLQLGSGAISGIGNASANLLYAGAGDNLLRGGGGSDTVSYRLGIARGATTGVVANLASGTASGSSGNDTLVGIRHLEGTDFSDSLTGNGAANRLDGGSGGDTLSGGDGNDTLRGGSDSDQLNGGGGNDTLYGGSGADYLRGGAGSDRFVFTAVEDSPAVSRSIDLVMDFESGIDRIDLSAIDADPVSRGDQAFAPGQLAYDAADGWLYADLVGNGVDLQFRILDVSGAPPSSLLPDDLIL